MATTWPASEKQIAFVQDLLDTREVTIGTVSLVTEIKNGTLTSKAASAAIDILKTYAVKPATSKPAPVAGKQAQLAERLGLLQKSRYAVHHAELGTVLTHMKMDNDFLFVEVKEWRGRLFMNRLHGSAYGFSRTRISLDDAYAIAGVLLLDPYSFAKEFGKQYSCCGKCGAELTDARSRELFLGPTCRKAFGYDK